jgi:hypothetical protein
VLIQGENGSGKELVAITIHRTSVMSVPVASLAVEADGESMACLTRGMTVTRVATVAVFRFLTGVWSWLIDSHPPTWFLGATYGSVSCCCLESA